MDGREPFEMPGRKQLAEVSRRNRVELIEAGLSRRDLVKLGLLTAGGYLVAKLGLSSRALGRGPAAHRSPPTTAWVEELPIPPAVDAGDVAALGAIRPSRDPNAAAGEGGRTAPHQHWALFDAGSADFHRLEARATPHSWHRELPTDECWTFNGRFPGPRLHARRGRPMLIRFRNELPALADHRGLGRPELATRLVNAHAASESDGHPIETLRTGQWRDQLHLHRPAGFTDSAFGPGGDPREGLSTLWYHDQCLDFMAQNLYRGLAGPCFVFDERDTGDEADATPGAWRLPSGAFDVPLVFHDRLFDASGRAYFDLFDLDGVLGDKYTVNGRIQPFLRVARRKYRFRLVNMGPSRHLDLRLSNGQPLVRISHDGCLLARPVTGANVALPVSGRCDVVVDFSRLPSGTRLDLVNVQEQLDGRGPTGRILALGAGDAVLRFVVDGGLETNGDPSRIPPAFVEPPPVDRAAAVTTRTFELDHSDGVWTVNGKPFDPHRITASPRLGSAEVWNLVNRSRTRAHTLHVPFETHQVLARGGVTPEAGLARRSDVVRLGPGESVSLFLRFRDFTGRYVAHCRDGALADRGMLFQWRVVA
jgi:FtsP/CotA-like multicopper oxidase with cupredoxin domain